MTRSTASEQIEASRTTASEQIKASHEQAKKMVDAAREQTSVTAEQTSRTIYLARIRDAAEAAAFRTMLEAAMARVLAEAAEAKKAYPNLFVQNARSDPTVEAYAVRHSARPPGRKDQLRRSFRAAASPHTLSFELNASPFSAFKRNDCRYRQASRVHRKRGLG